MLLPDKSLIIPPSRIRTLQNIPISNEKKCALNRFWVTENSMHLINDEKENGRLGHDTL